MTVLWLLGTAIVGVGIGWLINWLLAMWDHRHPQPVHAIEYRIAYAINQGREPREYVAGLDVGKALPGFLAEISRHEKERERTQRWETPDYGG